MSEFDRESRTVPMNRRQLLKCAAWAGAGVIWTMQGGVLAARDLATASGSHGAPMKGGGLSFVQISDSHIGFNKDPNPEPHVTLQSAIEQIRAMPEAPAFVVHTGDVSQLSKAEEFDIADQIIRGVRKPVHFVPGEHDVIGDNGAGFFQRFNGATDRRWYSFDHGGAHVVALANVLNLKAGGFGELGAEQLEWLEQDLRGRTWSTPIVVLAHMPLWTVYEAWGWGTDDALQALSYLRRFGSVTVLNGHIHQVMQKVEGNVQFHTGCSTAFPQPAPGTAPSPGPMKVPADRLRSVLGLSLVSRVSGAPSFVIADAPLNEATRSSSSVTPASITIENFTFAPAALEVRAGSTVAWVNEDDAPHTIMGSDAGSPLKSPALDTQDRYTIQLDRPGEYRYFCSLHPHMAGMVRVV